MIRPSRLVGLRAVEGRRGLSRSLLVAAPASIAVLLLAATLLLVRPGAAGAASSVLSSGDVQQPLSLTIALPLIFAPQPTPEPPSMTIAVAVQAPLSRVDPVRGADLAAGAQLAVNERLTAFAAVGLSLTLRISDDQSLPATGLANALALAADPAVRCVVGHLDVETALAAAETYHEEDLAFIAPSVHEARLTVPARPQIFRPTGRDDVVGKVAAWHAHVVLETPRVYLAHDGTAASMAMATRFVSTSIAFTEMTVFPVEVVTSTAEIPAVVTDMKTKDPDLVFFAGEAEVAGALLRSMREADVEAIFMGGPTLATPEWLTIAGVDALNSRYITYTAPLWKYPGDEVDRFATAFAAREGRDATPVAAQGYEAMQSCLSALLLAHDREPEAPPTREAVIIAMFDIDEIGPLNEITFNSEGDLVSGRYFVETVTSLKLSEWGDWYTFYWWSMPP